MCSRSKRRMRYLREQFGVADSVRALLWPVETVSREELLRRYPMPSADPMVPIVIDAIACEGRYIGVTPFNDLRAMILAAGEAREECDDPHRSELLCKVIEDCNALLQGASSGQP